MAMKIGILGKGNVGSALERGLKRAGNEVRTAGHDAKAIRETAGWASVIVLAVPFGAIDSVVKEAGSAFEGKTVIDATNALAPDMSLAVGFRSDSSCCRPESQQALDGGRWRNTCQRTDGFVRS